MSPDDAPRDLLEAYGAARRAEDRVKIVFDAIKLARQGEEAVKLGLAALNDRATLVRYRACSLLAYSLRRDVIPALQALLAHADARTVADAKAAIDAIEHQNHHLFVDRNHTGRVVWSVDESDATDLLETIARGELPRTS